MLKRALLFALTLIAAGMWESSEVAARPSQQSQSPWLRTESHHFEIHYQSGLARDLDRVVRSAEAAYDHVSQRLNFSLAAKVPLVMFAPSGPSTVEEVVEYATGNQVAPPQPHRSRIVLPVSDTDARLDTRIIHELTHLLMSEIILPGQGGDGGVPRWVHEGIASHIAAVWSDEDARLMRELVAARDVPALSRLTGGGGFANEHLNEALGHAAFDYIESRWGPTSIRRFLDALIVPRSDKTYDAVFELTPAEFDTAFQQYAERRFQPAVR